MLAKVEDSSRAGSSATGRGRAAGCTAGGCAGARSTTALVSDGTSRRSVAAMGDGVGHACGRPRLEARSEGGEAGESNHSFF